MRWPVIFLALGGLAAIAAAVEFAAQEERVASVVVDPIDVAHPVSTDVPAVGPKSAPVQVSRLVRPGVVAPPSIAPGELERIAPREPLGDLGNAGRHGADGPKPTGLFQPVAVAAGIVQSKGYTVRLAGIDIVPVDEKCGSGATAWNCGIVARTAFRSFLRGRALSCILPDEGRNFTLSCTLGDEDPALWLARQGWARGAEGDYADALEQARKEWLGIFGQAPD